MTRRLSGRIALLTGASRGIGRAAAIAFAREGAHVIALATSQDGLEDLGDEIKRLGGTTTLVKADLRDLDSIDRLGPALLERWTKLDIFCGNAAIFGPISPLVQVRAEDWDDVMLVNVTANFRLIRTLDPLLQRSDSGRVILMTSSAAWRHVAHRGPYSVSKAALEALARIYAKEVDSTPIRVMAVDPGPLRTDMRAAAVPEEESQQLRDPAEIVPHLIDIATASWIYTGKLLVLSEETPLLYDFGTPMDCRD